ncbi:MAG: hypothetical protein JNN11_01790 [Candidatus Doudnabacteria bacterium]|nr:hypothetical protein [Candidatus Doudnabacteria bacterium]
MKFDVYFFEAKRLQEFSALLDQYVYPKNVFWKRLPTDKGDYFMIRCGEVYLGGEPPIADIIADTETDASTALSEKMHKLKTAA